MTKLEKQVQRLLKSTAGRAALKKHGIDVEVVRDGDADKPCVVVLCPTYRAPEPQMQDALSAMVKYTREKNFATVYGGPPLSASVVHWSRNGLISEHLKSGKPWTHVLFIDDDIVIEPDTLERLLSHKKDIVAGLCTRRQDPPVPNIRFFDKSSGMTRQIWEWPENALVEVDAVGTGLMLISKYALEQVAQAYFDCLWEQKFYGFAGEQLERLKSVRLKKFDDEKICYWFRFLPTPHGDIEMGEDITFCHIAKEYCDIPIYVDSAVTPGHLGNYPFSVRDFLPYRDEMVLKAKITGDYPIEVPPMKISILCPTRGRPENCRRLVNSVRSSCTIMPQLVLYVDDDDEAAGEYEELLRLSKIKTNDGKDEPLILLRGPRITLSNCWNRCAEAATGEILMHAGDDIVFKTKGWDDMVRRAFAAFPDRLVFVHGEDGVWGNKFGTHGFLHRAWMDAVGYFCPPYFSSDYNDTWFNDVFNALNRRIFLPFETEHMHPLAGKAEWDKTHKERLERHKADGVDKLYKELAPARFDDVSKVAKRLDKPYEMVNPDSHPADAGGFPQTAERAVDAAVNA